MALPTFVGVTAGDVPHSSSALSVPLPTGIAANDKLFLFINCRASESIGAITGWAQTSFSPIDPGAGDYELTIFERDATGSDTDPTVPDSGDHQIAFIAAFRSGTGALLEIKHSNTGTAAASTSLSFPTITTTGNDYLVLNAVSDDWDDQSATRYSSWTNASLGSVTERYDGGWTTNGGGGLGLASGTKATAGAVSATTATLASSVAVSMATFAIGDVAGASTQNITGALFTNSQTFYGATVGRGAVNIDGALVTNAQTFYGATVAASYAITGSKFDNSQTFYQATVTPGSVDIAGALFTNSQIFPATTVTPGAVGVSGGLFTNSQIFPTATITAIYAVSGGLFTNSQIFPTATVERGPIEISGGLFTNSHAFYSAAVSGETLVSGWGIGGWGNGAWGAGAPVSVALTGFSTVTELGEETVTGAANVSPTNVSATVALASVAVTAGAVFAVTGVETTGEIGDVTASLGVHVTGVTATTAIGTVMVWGQIPVDPPDGGWVVVPSGPGGGWSPVSAGPSGSWVPIANGPAGGWVAVSAGPSGNWVNIVTS